MLKVEPLLIDFESIPKRSLSFGRSMESKNHSLSSHEEPNFKKRENQFPSFVIGIILKKFYFALYFFRPNTEAIIYASHLINELSSTMIGGKTPLDIWTGGAA